MLRFFIFGVLIASTGKPVNGTCNVEMSPPKVMVKFGDSFTANCTSLYSEIAGIGWESTYGGIGLQSGISTLPFKIDVVKDWDIQPICYVTLPDGDQCLEPLPVTVYQIPESVSIAQPLSAGPMVEGKQYHIQCNIVNVAPASLLSVYWHKGDKIISHETFKESAQSPVSKSSILNLTAQRDDDGSQIWCEAKLNLGPGELNHPAMQSKSHEMAVLYPPGFINPEMETVELPDRKNVTLYCNATGNPVPVYSWDVPQAVQETSKKEDMNKPFLIPFFQLPGNYSCKASNSQGTRIKYFTVIEAPRDRTTLAAIIGVFVALGVLLFIGGALFVTRDGTFSCNQSKYLRGQPSGAV
ncbi:cell adhesion molecule 3-like isoform X1 [Acanthochromis polyacanthus]|uniref:cell adhesion molecule 3-like isoform X1 n=2 Tax=Acanthochromis polyacanthus TaxID=80966 RepID=UPI00223436EE|nr:cell adhesion molecule 3-like isoform X1 [Acanthochromis polyacanthus]